MQMMCQKKQKTQQQKKLNSNQGWVRVKRSTLMKQIGFDQEAYIKTSWSCKNRKQKASTLWSLNKKKKIKAKNARESYVLSF